MSVEFKAPSIQFNLGTYSDAFTKAIERAKADHVVERMWLRDSTVWSQKPEEISSRLGWLDIAERMRAEIPALEQFAEYLKSEGFTHALLLGMGGSSLAPELFSHIFGKKDGLHLGVLDSTDPAAVRASAERFDPQRTLYIVSTKSGDTIETLSFFKYFYNEAQAALGNAAGAHFIAITDPGSSLASIAEKYSFQHVFLADPNIGGRYSALSHFGLVPAALVGIDLNKFLDRAETAAKQCQTGLEDNSAALLGLALGVLATAGRDKATLIISDEIFDFGNWVEQLVAESTGKQGKGILPIVDEPLIGANDYGQDRVFIEFGGQVDAIEMGGHPTVRLDWEDIYDLGGQFFLWEFANAVVGYAMGINPFDQPNVEAAKVRARTFVDEYTKGGKLPKGEGIAINSNALKNFLRKVEPGDYIALQAYATPSEEIKNGLNALRGDLLKTYKIATTFGYGPRFLHSTGQLHKGDAGNGLFIQFVTLPPKSDLPIPKEAGKPESEISFGALKVAQALGDAQALLSAGRRVLTFETSGDLNSELKKLLADVEQS